MLADENGPIIVPTTLAGLREALAMRRQELRDAEAAVEYRQQRVDAAEEDVRLAEQGTPPPGYRLVG